MRQHEPGTQQKVGDVLPEGVIASNAEGNPRAVILHHIVGDDGLTDKQRNMKLEHKIPLGSLVEIQADSAEDGLRLLVAHLGRDCDGTPLYWLTADPDALRFNGDIWDNGRLRQDLHGKLDGGWSDHSLKLIKYGEAIMQALKDEGKIDSEGNWYR